MFFFIGTRPRDSVFILDYFNIGYNSGYPPENLPVHPINIVGTGLASVVSDDCITSNHIVSSNWKLIHKPNHHHQTRFMYFFLTSIEGKLYVELHNFSFVCGQQALNSNPIKCMSWANSKKSHTNTSALDTHDKSHQLSSTSNAKAIHNKFHKSQQTISL